MTVVVNINSGAAYDVYCGRAGKGQDGYFGNPFRLTVDSVQARVEALQQFQAYFYTRLRRDPEFKRRVHELKGKRLGCFCKPKPCHVDIIVEYVNSLEW